MGAKGIIAVVVLCVTVCDVLSQTRSGCPGNQVLHSNGICCQYVSCKPQHYVRECETEGGADRCVPCPHTAYLDDPTDSNFVFPCLHKNCGEDTVPIDVPATTWNSSACAKRCRCNPVKNYCGTDPCMCRYKLCNHGETLLQNCTCVRETKVQSTPSSTTDRVPISEPSPVTPTGRVSSGHPQPGPPLNPTERKVKDDDRKTNGDNKDSNDVSSNVSSSNESSAWWISIPFVCVFIIGFSVFGVVYIKRTKKPNVEYSNVNVHNHTTIHNYHNSKVQIGDKNTMNACEPVSECEDSE